MKPTRTILVALCVLAAGATVLAQQHEHQGHSPYAGQETRTIKSLSDDDLAELRRGGGWGLAKAAELNGMPGPAHLLELKDEIGLSEEQVAAIQDVFDDMQAAAIEEGERYIALETRLEESFRDRTITEDGLRDLLREIADSQASLRMIHLRTHLSTPALLSEDQVAKYNALRGYGASDPCANVPAGHDEAMWRKHNGCS